MRERNWRTEDLDRERWKALEKEAKGHINLQLQGISKYNVKFLNVIYTLKTRKLCNGLNVHEQ